MGEEENKEEEAHDVTTKTAAGAPDPAATNGHIAEGGGELNEGRKVLHAEARADKGSDSDDGDTSDTFHDAESTSPGLDDAETEA